uniref:Uncharacterized protein n=1 Tax=Strongyloides papillosus TaxID=174720 RepID=A0A0N5C2Y4_STREA
MEEINRFGSSESLSSTQTLISSSISMSVFGTPETSAIKGLNTTIDVFRLSPGSISIMSNMTIKTPLMGE